MIELDIEKLKNSCWVDRGMYKNTDPIGRILWYQEKMKELIKAYEEAIGEIADLKHTMDELESANDELKDDLDDARRLK